MQMTRGWTDLVSMCRGSSHGQCVLTVGFPIDCGSVRVFQLPLVFVSGMRKAQSRQTTDCGHPLHGPPAGDPQSYDCGFATIQPSDRRQHSNFLEDFRGVCWCEGDLSTRIHFQERAPGRRWPRMSAISGGGTAVHRAQKPACQPGIEGASLECQLLENRS